MTNQVNKKDQLADCFKLLAVFFYEPEIEIWQQEDIPARFAEIIKKTIPDAFPAADRMGKALEKISEAQMKVDHAALFVGPFELLAAPYGSVYLEKNRQIMGDSTMAVNDLYRQAGLKLDVQDAPDHIAIELEFMHYLYCLEAEAAQGGDTEKEISTVDLRAFFLTSCLAPWVHQFCQCIQIGTNNIFYTNLAECLDTVIGKVAEAEFIASTEKILPQKEDVLQSAI